MDFIEALNARSTRCLNCSEPTKRPAGFFDGPGQHGTLFDCDNPTCEVAVAYREYLDSQEKKRQAVRQKNAANGVDISELRTLMAKKGVLAYDAAARIYVSSATMSAYINGKEAMPVLAYSALMQWLNEQPDKPDKPDQPKIPVNML